MEQISLIISTSEFSGLTINVEELRGPTKDFIRTMTQHGFEYIPINLIMYMILSETIISPAKINKIKERIALVVGILIDEYYKSKFLHMNPNDGLSGLE